MLTKLTSSTIEAGKSGALAGVNPNRTWIAFGGLFGLLGVVAGAAGVHVLGTTLDADSLDTFETAVRFQMYHAIAAALRLKLARSLAIGVVAIVEKVRLSHENT